MVDKYVKPAISGYNSSPPPDDDSQTSANAVSWAKHKNKLADPLKALLDAVNAGVDTLADSMFGNAVRADSAGGTMATSDYGKLIKTSNAVTVTLLTGSDAGSNFTFAFYNSDSTNNLTIGRNGANINGAASNLTIYPKQGGIAFCDGTDWWIFVIITPDGKNTFTNDITMSGKSIIYAGSDLAAHATTMDPWSGGNYRTLTGSAVTFTAMAAAPQAGAEVELYMNAAHIFTDGAVFEVDGDQNYTATIGDRVLIRAKSTILFTVHPRKKDGTAVAVTSVSPITLATPVASTSGTAIDFTAIPAGTKRVTVMFVGVSTNGISIPIVQIGDSGGIETTCYVGVVSYTSGGDSLTAGFGIVPSAIIDATMIFDGAVTLSLENSSNNTWVAFGGAGVRVSATTTSKTGGSKSLSAALDRIRITTVNGTDAFDAGEINISYE